MASGVRRRIETESAAARPAASWTFTPATPQATAAASAAPTRSGSSPASSTDGLIPIANGVHLAALNSCHSERDKYDGSSAASTASAASCDSGVGLRVARRLPTPLVFPTTPPPSPPRDFVTTDSYSSSLMSSVIVDDREEESCPICLELLSLRLAGERAHVVPVCGHRLHYSCFEAVYGDVNRAKARTSGSLGLCGVCRRDMKIGDVSEGPSKKINKFAKLTGLALSNRSKDAPSFKLRSRTQGTIAPQDLDAEDDDFVPKRKSREDDDDLVVPAFSPAPGSAANGPRSSGSTGGTFHIGGGGGNDIVRPVLTVRSEQSSVERSSEPGKKQHLSCMISVEVPPRHAPAALALELLSRAQAQTAPDFAPSPPAVPPPHTSSASVPSLRSIPRSASPSRSSTFSARIGHQSAFAQDPPRAPPRVVQDLAERMADWKGHSLDEFDELRIHDALRVRKDAATREFLVYLFDEAILCVSEDKHKADDTTSSFAVSGDKLRLKGRVYLRHVRSVAETSTPEELSLTITMNDEAVAEFVLVFRERTSLEVWRAQIERLLDSGKEPRRRAESTYPQTPASAHPPARSRKDIKSDLSTSDRSRLTSFSSHTRTTNTSLAPSSSTIPEESACEDDFEAFIREQAAAAAIPSTLDLPLASSSGSTESRRDFTPLDLVIVVSIPGPGTGTLKTDIIKNALQCLVANVGPLTRLSLVAYTAGDGTRGMLRKTPFVAVGTAEGRRRLETAFQELASDGSTLDSLIEHREDRVNVVTACNLALDSVLQRKAKSALTGMVLINEGRDGAGKQQMDLIMARAEAAGVPIHAIGYGRSHDPSSLWLLSNHTSGSYTFVKDFYDLRDALTGCVGGIMSVAVTNLRLHVRVPESRWFRIRKVSGTPGAVIAHTGVDVDVELGEMRFGERKDLIVEVEMAFDGYEPRSGRGVRADPGHGREFSSATETFFLTQAGVDLSALDASGTSNLYADEYDAMPDELPLFQVNAAYRDPAAGKSISRLTQTPTLLTITVAAPSSSPRQVSPAAAPELVRRRVELLVSDMLSRALLLMTRRNEEQALRLLGETKRIIASISASMRGATPGMPRSPYTSSSGALRRGSHSSTALHAQNAFLAMSRDVDAIHEAFLSREAFETQGRYQAAQQAVVLRDQRSWVPKSAIERLFWRADHALWMVTKSQQWISP